MPIASDVLTHRLREVGRIRIGEKRTGNKNGRTYTFPSKLESFRFTSRDEQIIRRVAEWLGGEAEPWDSDEGPQWQVKSPSDCIDVVLPKAELAFSQYLELWSAGGCQRRCDGIRETITDQPCVCDPGERECKPHTRLSVMLPDLPGIGLWRLDTQGWNAGAELLGAVEVAEAYGAAYIPARLRLEIRQKKRPNPQTGKVETLKFGVPVLDLDLPMRQYAQMAAGRVPAALPSPHNLADEDLMVPLRIGAFKAFGKDRDVRLAWMSEVLHRNVTTISKDHDLTRGEVLILFDALPQTPLGIDPVEAMEAEADWDPFANIDGNEEVEGSAVSADGPSDGPDAAPAGQIKSSVAHASPEVRVPPAGAVPAADKETATVSRGDPKAVPSSPEQVSGVGKAGTSPSPSSTPEKLPLKVETKVQAHQRMASTTRHKGESPAAPDALGRVRAAAEAGPSAPMGSAVSSESGEGKGGRVVSEGGDANSGDPSPAWTTTERTPTDPLHWLAPNDGVELIQKCSDDPDVARSVIGAWMAMHGLKSLDDPKDYAEFLHARLGRKAGR